MNFRVHVKLLLCGVAAMIFLPSCSHSAFTQSSDIVDYLDHKTRDLAVPGVQYVVVGRDGPLFSYAGGFADIAASVPMKQSSRLMAYSMTKTLVAILALRLYEKGIVDINRSVKHYFPESPYGSDLKVSHLLSQSSGIPNPMPLRWAHLVSEHGGVNESELFWQRLGQAGDLDFRPGEKYAYSNLSYVMLGALLEKATGKPLSIAFHEEITRPLGLASEVFGFKFTDSERPVRGYLKRWSWINFLKYFVIDPKFYSDYEKGWLRINPHYVDFKAMGGLIGSAAAFSAVLQDLLREDSRILNKASKSLLFSPALNNAGGKLPMTLGWHMRVKDGRTILFKEGGGAGFHCEMRVYPNRKIASVIMTNSTTYDVKGFLDRADAVFLGTSLD